MGPEISVAVPSRDRPLRLRWLLNALEEQTLAPGRWEVVVAHDSVGDETEELLASHSLARAGCLRGLRRPPGSAPPGANRNAAWRGARAKIVAFIDDDCRPAHDWLERALEAAWRAPGAILQGTTRPDPDERTGLQAQFFHTQHITPPDPFGQACNILYPRSVLEWHAGFDEQLMAGEDVDLLARARSTGVPYLAAPEVVVFHAIVPLWPAARLRSAWRWRDLPAVVRRHPCLRDHFPGRLFWRRSHARLLLASLALVAGRRRPTAAALAIPYAGRALARYGRKPRKLARGLVELPTTALVDLGEVVTLAWGSATHRTLFL